MKRKIAGIVLIAISLVVMITEIPKGNTEPIGPSIIFIIAGLFLLIKKFKTKEEKDSKRKEKELLAERWKRTLNGKHFSGLPLGENIETSLLFNDNDFTVDASGNSFSLPYSRVISMEVASDVEIQKSYISSIGGAVGGAVLFGPLGAVIGGRARERQSKVVEYYLVITYDKDGSFEYLSFSIEDVVKAKELIHNIEANFSSGRQIAL